MKTLSIVAVLFVLAPTLALAQDADKSQKPVPLEELKWKLELLPGQIKCDPYFVHVDWGLVFKRKGDERNDTIAIGEVYPAITEKKLDSPLVIRDDNARTNTFIMTAEQYEAAKKCFVGAHKPTKAE